MGQAYRIASRFAILNPDSAIFAQRNNRVEAKLWPPVESLRNRIAKTFSIQ
jgi:hypothetical protein